MSCNKLNGVSVSVAPSPSLVSALCNFSERAGSQCYIHVYLNIQVFNTSHCYDIMSFVFSQHLHYVRLWGGHHTSRKKKKRFLHNVALSYLFFVHMTITGSVHP